jgi:para-aminobenzoate synthetase component 1
MSNFEPGGYRSVVQDVIDYIHAGDVFQVNIAQRLLHPAISEPIDLYSALRAVNPAPFGAFYDLGTQQICSTSPERFLRVRDRTVETRPIKGTRPRFDRPEAQLFSGAELRGSDKDLAENVMIVDLMRNDLSRTCADDSVSVSQLCAVETYQFVQHLVSVVQGRLRDDASLIDLISTSFPGGSITGAPKVRAMEIISELEPTARGAYCGCLGYLGFDGSLDLNILIRTVTVSDGWWQFPVGGGIVAQSVPYREYEETWHKAAGILEAIQAIKRS